MLLRTKAAWTARYTSGAILMADKTGKLGALAGVSYADGVLDVATSTVSAAAVRAPQLTLTSSKNAALLSTNSAGEVVGASAATLDRVEVKQGLSITTKASLELQGREANTLLALNGKGELVTVPRPAAKGDASAQAAPAVDAHLRELRATTMSVDALTAGKAVVQELHLFSDAAATGAVQQEDTAVSGSLLVRSKVSIDMWCELVTC
jgi:phage terminase large subunit-like protein